MPAETGRLAEMAEDLGQDPRWAPWPIPNVIARIDSTMAWLRERTDAPDGTSLIADEQTAGRGRLGRTWVSPPGVGVWSSVLVHADEVDPATLGMLPLTVGLCVAENLSEVTGTGISVKWPNDIVIETDGRVRKIGGILTERCTDGAIIIGVGVNALPGDHPLPEGAIAVGELVSAGSLTREQIALAVLTGIAEAARSWRVGDVDLEAFRRRCITLGRVVEVASAAQSESWTGEAVDVASNGALLVRRGDGRAVLVTAGDVTLTPDVC